MVVTTLMLHHLPRPSRRQLAQEMRRVLKPGGRALVIDFAEGHSHTAKILSHFHQPHGHSTLQEMVALLSDAGFAIVDSGAVGMKNLQFVRGTVAADCPRFGEELSRSQVEPVEPSPPPTEPRNQARPGGQHAWGLAILVAVLLAVALHLDAVSSLINHGGDFSATSTWGFLAILGLVALKIGLMVCWRSRWRQGAHSEVEHG